MTERPPLGLYIHWPFCVSKCPYCDFNSHVRDEVDHAAWRETLLADLRHEAALTPGHELTSIFFGGGTPSLMPPATVAALIDAATGYWPVADDLEITLEANPSSVEAGRFADLAKAGVNRLSLGLQSLDDDALRFLGRAHGVAEGLAALDVAQGQFDRVTFDLIYALPDQDLAAWEAMLHRALGFGTTHLSLYQLTIEPGTRFATMVQQGGLLPKDADEAADFFELTQAMTADAGLPMYEVSNHAAKGQESRHNLVYWRYQDYAGIGPGAHGRRGGMATMRHKKPENWMAALARNEHGCQEETVLSLRDRAAERLLMGLRLVEGLAIPDWQAAYIDWDRVDRLVIQGLMTRQGNHIAASANGMLLLNALIDACFKGDDDGR
ncbi:radical SAM family heme chaperone HemW [Aquisediminimonas sediminicola]|uniref:radical SAM family heme chaperone HemW n=1 Tax=Alteraquisediminimonas sediminicola TaxID=2676787 RepID=UPI001C8E7618